MMEVGNLNGMGGPNNNVSLGVNESRSHFGAWVTVSSPLVLGMDITNASNLDSVWHFIANPEAIAVNQAWDGEPGRLVWSGFQPYYDVVVKRVAHVGELPQVAVLIVNKDAGELNVELPLSLFGLPTASAEKPAYSVRDIWERKDVAVVQLGTNQTWAVQKVPPHDSVFLMFSPHKH